MSLSRTSREASRRRKEDVSQVLGGGEGVLIFVHAVVVRPLTSHPYKAGTEHAGFSPDQALTSPSAKRSEVFGESHAGRAASC